MNLDHVNGRVAGTPFACLCANCHTIKSRANDWNGEKPDRDTVTDPPNGLGSGMGRRSGRRALSTLLRGMRW
jgi:hypothetical protein